EKGKRKLPAEKLSKLETRKEKKAKKDPYKPKRAPTAFFVFLEDFRKTFKKEIQIVVSAEEGIDESEKPIPEVNDEDEASEEEEQLEKDNCRSKCYTVQLDIEIKIKGSGFVLNRNRRRGSGVKVELSVRDLESGALLYMTYWNFDFYTS
ncbi:hypothetical protein DY000_02032964, partial [Brassica cretica]